MGHWVVAQHFPVWNDVMAAILNLWRQIKNPTPSGDAYLLEEISCQISSQADRNVRAILQQLTRVCKHYRTCMCPVVRNEIARRNLLKLLIKYRNL